jgi:hypothetical protein
MGDLTSKEDGTDWHATMSDTKLDEHINHVIQFIDDLNTQTGRQIDVLKSALKERVNRSLKEGIESGILPDNEMDSEGYR